MSVFGDNLKRIRMERGLTQDDLADMVGTSKQVISRYENGQRSPKVTVVAFYAGLLNVPISQLIGEEELKKQPYSIEEERLIAAYRRAEPVIARAALEMLENHPAKAEERLA